MHRQHTRNLRTMVFWWRAWSWLLHLWSMASEMSSLRCETVWSLGDGILDLTSNSLIFLKQQPSFGPKRLFLPISSPEPIIRLNCACCKIVCVAQALQPLSNCMCHVTTTVSCDSEYNCLWD